MFAFKPQSSFSSQSRILEEKYLPVEDAAGYSGYNVQYLRRLLRNGKLAGVKVGQVWLIKLASLDFLIEKSNQSPDRRYGSKQARGRPPP